MNRRNVKLPVTSNYHADAAFVDTVFECHLAAAAMTLFSMKEVTDMPACFCKAVEWNSDTRKKKVIRNIAAAVVDKFVFHKMVETLDLVSDGVNSSVNTQTSGVEADGVYNYACNFMKFGYLRRIACITTAAGDGERTIRNWKYSLVVYHDTHKTNYRLEAFLLLVAVQALLSKGLAEQVKWSRLSLSGGEGKHLDGDYVMELLNKLAKGRIKGLGPNHNANSVDMISKTLMFAHDVEMQLKWHQFLVIMQK